MTITVSGSNHVHVVSNTGWTMPSGVCNAGDLIIGASATSVGVQSGKTYYKTSPGTPAGWTTLLNAPNGNDTAAGATIMWRIASSADAAGTSTYAGMESNADCITSFVGLGGVNTVSPFDTTGPHGSGATATPNTSGTAGAANEMAVGVFFSWAPSGNFNYATGSINNSFAIQTNSVIDNFSMTQSNGFLPKPRRAQLLATRLLVSSGATGTTTLTEGTGGIASSWQTWTLFVKPFVASTKPAEVAIITSQAVNRAGAF